ncbi:MAG: alanine racemase, partial [Candidatus Marinimicrobia bacterium]|nr:alanine racemase [Candidatus Neomarinimicrobiota bacterium]
LNIVGVYSHFSSSDTASHRQFEKQRALFESFVSDIRTLGFRGLVHMSNSAAMLHDDFNTYDAMRLGIGLYGYDTSPGGSHQAALRPAMQVIAPLVRVDQVKAGEPVSYAEKWHADRDTNIGTLRIGYADGYNRLLTNNGSVSLNDEEFPVVGTVTMDHIMIDLGHKRIEPGTYFTVLGGDKRPVSIADVADRLGTIPYEVCCGISRRVQRIHLID